MSRGEIERTGGWLFRWRVRYPSSGEGFGIDTVCEPYFTRVGARFSEWFWRTL